MIPTLIDLFAGAGGLTQGFVQAGFCPILAVDNDEWSMRTYAENFGADHAVCARIEDITSFPDAMVVVGGPPCQGFSLLGRNDPENPLNDLWQQYLRAIQEVEPEVFVMENVPQLLRSAQYHRFRALARETYDISENILNAADYGVPQTRKRAIVIGSRIGPANRLIPNPTHSDPSKRRLGTRPWLDLVEALKDVPLKPTVEASAAWDATHPKSAEALHVGRSPTEASLARYRVIPEGGNRWDLLRERPDLTPDCWVKKTTGGTDLMGRLWWERPACTIRTEFFKPEKGRYLHPSEDRPITHWEAARIQTFPDDYRFLGSKSSVARQIGNAVPVGLAYAIGLSVMRSLKAANPEIPVIPGVR